MILIFIPFSYAGNLESGNNIEEIKQKTLEFIIKEEHFAYTEYESDVRKLEDILDDYREGKKVYWDSENIAIPNLLLRLKGYGLVTQKKIITLELENAKLKGVAKDAIADLESKFKEAAKQLKYFLEHNIWVD